jgi:hypothetical protein
MHWIDPDSLTPVSGRVVRFLFNPRGEADGLILRNGLTAHFPPHLSRAVLAQVEPGGSVKLFGVRPRGAELLACVAIETPRGNRIDDLGPPERKKHKPRLGRKDAAREVIQLEGTISRLLHGPKGELWGFLLEQGGIVRFPSHTFQGDRRRPGVGDPIAARGPGIDSPRAVVVEARELGPTLAKALPVRKPSKGH